MRILKYSEAIAEATLQAMEENPKVFLMGEGIDDPKGAFGTTLPAFKKFGASRVFDTPLSENAVTGIGIGAAIEGWPCVMIHMRNEFLLYAMDQIVNHAAKWHYMVAGAATVPIVIRCIVGRGWGQAAQHSQSLHALFSHIPGLKVILPSNAYDAKGMMIAAIRDPNPVICIEHRWLYEKSAEVPQEPYVVPLSKAKVVKAGRDLTCVAISHQVLDALSAQEILLKEGIEMEVIDLRSTRPIDKATIISSLRKTGRLMITDTATKVCGVSAEISAMVAEEAFDALRAPIHRITLPDAPIPCSFVLEKEFYPSVAGLVERARKLVLGKEASGPVVAPIEIPKPFVGPF